MTFNANIKLLRQRRKPTQDHVAGELGISRSTLNSYENGSVQNPNTRDAHVFLKVFPRQHRHPRQTRPHQAE
ncbi:MAG: helix-turn-helix transcriptional regulator [Bacteroidetes bacterium]|nr:helix-turn-helix transcriptional regulator [Bacteroidota bacterium]